MSILNAITHGVPAKFQWLLDNGYILQNEMISTVDGFFVIKKSIASIHN